MSRFVHYEIDRKAERERFERDKQRLAIFGLLSVRIKTLSNPKETSLRKIPKNPYLYTLGEQLIPSSYTTQTEVSVKDFSRETRIASIFARDGSGIVRLIAQPGEGGAPGRLMITARADDIGNNEGEIDAVVEGAEAKSAFNGRYLTDVLQVLDSERVAIESTSPSSPGVIRPVGDDSYVHVVMPMFVQWD